MSSLTLISILAQEAATAAPKASGASLLILIVTLGVFVAILIAYKRGHAEADAEKAAKAPAPAPKPSPVQPAVVADDPVLIAVLAAAAYETLGQNVRIVSVKPASTEWGMQGRRDIFISHKIR